MACSARRVGLLLFASFEELFCVIDIEMKLSISVLAFFSPLLTQWCGLKLVHACNDTEHNVSTMD